MALGIVRTLNVGICLDVLTEPEIFNAISEDGATVNHLNIDVINDYWLELFDDKVTIGIVQLKPMTKHSFDSHIHILPEHRKHSKECGKMILDWCKKRLPDSLLYTSVPVFCGNVIKFLESFDFKRVGVLEKSWFKNGTRHDQLILTRLI